MKKYIGIILFSVNIIFIFLIMKIFNMKINVNSIFWGLTIQFIAYIVEVYLLLKKRKIE